jgi:tape measure domain-containing protein
MAIEVERLVIALEARFDRYDANLRASQAATDTRLRAMENRFQRFASNVRSSTSGAALNLQTAFAGIGAYLSGRELVEYADGWNTVTRSLEASEQIFGVRLRSAKELNALANSARADLDAYAKLYQRTAAATRDLGVAEEDVAKATFTVSMALKLGSASAGEQASTMLQLSQALQKGKLDGDEFRAVMENAGVVQELLAKRLNVSKGALLQMAADGKLAVKELFGALRDGYDEVKRIFEQMPATIEESFVVLKNAVMEYVGSVDDATGASQAFIDLLSGTAQNIEVVGDAALVAGAALLGLFSPAVIGGIAAAGVGIAAIAGPIGWLVGAVAAGAAAFAFLADDITVSADGVVTVKDYISALISVLGDKLQPAIDLAASVWAKAVDVMRSAMAGIPISLDDVAKAARTAANAMVHVMSVAVDMIKAGVTTLPAAIAETFIDMANRVIRTVTWMANGVVDILNNLPGVNLPHVNIDEFKNSFEGSRAELADTMRAAGGALGRGFVDKLGGEVRAGLDNLKSEIGDQARELALGRGFAESTTTRRAIPTRASRPTTTPTKKGRLNAFERDVRRTQEHIREMQLENQLLGANAEQTTQARTALELLNNAKRAGLEITPALLAQIDQLSGAYAKAKTEADRLKQRFEDMKSLTSDVLKGFITDLKDGKSGAEALHGALDKIANKLIDMAVNQVMENAIGPLIGAALGGGSGGTSAALSIFPHAKGGIAANGKPLPVFARGGISDTAAIFGETGRPEAAVPLPDGRRIPVDLRVDSAKPARGSVGGSIDVNIRASELLMADVESRAEGVVARRAPQIVGAAVGQVDKAMPGMIRKAQKRSL